MGKKRLFPAKVFFPVLLIIAAIHIGILYVCGWRPFSHNTEKTAASEDAKIPNREKINLPSAAPAAEKFALQKPSISAQEAKIVKPLDFSSARKLPKAKFGKLRTPRSGIVVELESRKVLWAKEAQKPVPVASLTKLMTTLIVMEKISEGGQLSLNAKIPVTKAATSVERSNVLGMQKGETYTVNELLASALINSHNDAAAQLAEATAGSVPVFVKKMNARAMELGLISATFNSPNGLPQGKARVNSYCSAADIVHICELLMKYPEVMKLCATKQQKIHTGRTLRSHNRLLSGKYPVPGFKGFKTGFTNAAGFCLAFGVERKGKYIIGCVTGFPSASDRDNFCRQLINWSFN